MEIPEIPKFRLSLKDLPVKIKHKLKEYYRVLKITKKPTTEEFKAIVKVAGLGILIIGAIGFAIFLILALISGGAV